MDLVVGPYISRADTLLAYLPLAHVFEFMFEAASLYWGTTMGYGNPRTISSASTKNSLGDIAEFKPSILVGVPAIWETVRKGIVGKVDESGFVVRKLFWAAYAAKNFLMGHGLPGASILDAVVFKKVRQATGGRLRLCMNGAAPIAKDTQRFISMVLAPVLGGYGLTETSACASPSLRLFNNLTKAPQHRRGLPPPRMDRQRAGQYPGLLRHQTRRLS